MSPFVWLAVAAVMAVVEVASFGLITMWFVIGALAAFAANLLGADPVSYTHLDVYKRQVLLRPLRGAALDVHEGGEQGVRAQIGQLLGQLLSLIHIYSKPARRLMDRPSAARVSE